MQALLAVDSSQGMFSSGLGSCFSMVVKTWSRLGGAGHGWPAQCSAGLGRIRAGQVWARLDWTGLGRTDKLDRAGENWTGEDW